MTLLGDCDLSLSLSLSLNDSEGQSGSHTKRNRLETGLRPIADKKIHVTLCITYCVRLHTDRMTDRPN